MDLQQLGKYRILAKIGQGSMGEVFRAHDPVLGRDVAIKLMSAAFGDNEELRMRFQREARSAGRLNHPNIVTIYDFGQDQGRIFIAMELLEGRDLKELIAHQTPLGLDEKLDLVQQICEGLAFAHSKEVIHRDLKPANVQRLPSGLAKIMDFGLAKYAASDITGSGMIMGTPHYMSPEQVRGERATAQSDVFSLGVLFYELLSYRKPFTADSLHAILFQVMHDEPEPLARAAPGVPRAVCAVVERALDKDLGRRYPNAGAMRQALRQALARTAAPTTLAPVPPASSPPTGTRRPGRALILFAVAGAGFLLLCSAVGLMAYRFSRSAPPTEPSTLVTRPPPPPTAAASAAPAFPVAAPASPAAAPRPTDRPGAAAEKTPGLVGGATPRAPSARALASASPVVRAPSRPSARPLPPPRPSPSSPPPPSPPPVPDQAAAVQDIQRVLSRYRSAFETLDVDALKAVQPGVNERSARQLFASVKGYEVGLKVERINVSGLVATVECVGTYNPVPRPAGAKGKSLRQLFELTWNGQTWLIVRVHTRP